MLTCSADLWDNVTQRTTFIKGKLEFNKPPNTMQRAHTFHENKQAAGSEIIMTNIATISNERRKKRCSRLVRRGKTEKCFITQHSVRISKDVNCDCHATEQIERQLVNRVGCMLRAILGAINTIYKRAVWWSSARIGGTYCAWTRINCDSHSKKKKGQRNLQIKYRRGAVDQPSLPQLISQLLFNPVNSRYFDDAKKTFCGALFFFLIQSRVRWVVLRRKSFPPSSFILFSFFSLPPSSLLIWFLFLRVYSYVKNYYHFTSSLCRGWQTLIIKLVRDFTFSSHFFISDEHLNAFRKTLARQRTHTHQYRVHEKESVREYY